MWWIDRGTDDSLVFGRWCSDLLLWVGFLQLCVMIEVKSYEFGEISGFHYLDGKVFEITIASGDKDVWEIRTTCTYNKLLSDEKK